MSSTSSTSRNRCHDTSHRNTFEHKTQDMAGCGGASWSPAMAILRNPAPQKGLCFVSFHPHRVALGSQDGNLIDEGPSTGPLHKPNPLSWFLSTRRHCPWGRSHTQQQNSDPPSTVLAYPRPQLGLPLAAPPLQFTTYNLAPSALSHSPEKATTIFSFSFLILLAQNGSALLA